MNETIQKAKRWLANHKLAVFILIILGLFFVSFLRKSVPRLITGSGSNAGIYDNSPSLRLHCQGAARPQPGTYRQPRRTSSI